MECEPDLRLLHLTGIAKWPPPRGCPVPVSVESWEMARVRDREAVDDPVNVLCARAREVSVATARLLEAIVAVASDARPGFDADEVAFALAWTQSAARSQVEFGRYLTRVVPDVFAALGRGAIDVRRAWVFADVLALVDDSIGRDDSRCRVAGRRRSHDEPTSGSSPPCGPEGRSGCGRPDGEVDRRPPRWVPGRSGRHGESFRRTASGRTCHRGVRARRCVRPWS